MPVFSRGGWTLQICLISFCISDKFRKCQVWSHWVNFHTLIAASLGCCKLPRQFVWSLFSIFIQESHSDLHCFCSKLYQCDGRVLRERITKYEHEMIKLCLCLNYVHQTTWFSGYRFIWLMDLIYYKIYYKIKYLVIQYLLYVIFSFDI